MKPIRIDLRDLNIVVKRYYILDKAISISDPIEFCKIFSCTNDFIKEFGIEPSEACDYNIFDVGFYEIMFKKYIDDSNTIYFTVKNPETLQFDIYYVASYI